MLKKNSRIPCLITFFILVFTGLYAGEIPTAECDRTYPDLLNQDNLPYSLVDLVFIFNHFRTDASSSDNLKTLGEEITLFKKVENWPKSKTDLCTAWQKVVSDPKGRTHIAGLVNGIKTQKKISSAFVAPVLKTSGISGYSLDAKASGVLDYLVLRVEEETSMVLLDILREKIDKNDMLATFFPNSIRMIKDTPFDSFEQLNFLWREAYQRDIDNLPIKITEAINDTITNPQESRNAFENLQPEHVSRLRVALMSLYLVNELYRANQAKDPMQSIIQNVFQDNKTIMEGIYAQVPDGGKILKLLERTTFTSELGKDISHLQTDDEKETEGNINLYLKLLLTDMFTGEQLKKLSEDAAKAVVVHQKSIELLKAVEAMNQKMKEIAEIRGNDKKNVDIKLTKFAELIDLYNALFKKGHSLYAQLAPQENIVDDQLDKMTSILSSTSLLVGHVKNKAYLTAVSDFGMLYVSLTGEPLASEVEKFLVLAGSIAEAETAEKARQAITAVAEPTGSYRRKRKEGTVSLSAYFGAYAAQETLNSTSAKFKENESAIYGMTIPIGLEKSFNICNNQSIALFLSIWDLGVAFSVRENDKTEVEGEESTVSNKEIGFSELFSPGLFLFYGLSDKLPFVAGLGIQKTPSLRNIENESGTVDVEADSTRLMFTIAYDLPLLYFR